MLLVVVVVVAGGGTSQEMTSQEWQSASRLRNDIAGDRTAVELVLLLFIDPLLGAAVELMLLSVELLLSRRR